MTADIHVMPMTLEGREEIRLSAILGGKMVAIANVVGVGKPVATIYQLFVTDNERRMGIGSELVYRAESEAQAWGAIAVSAIVLEDGPVEWWSNRGYDPVHCELGRMVVSKRLKG